MAMFILLGASDDPCLLAVGRSLARQRRGARILAHPFMDGASSAWRFDGTHSQAMLTIDGRPVALDGILAARHRAPQLAPSEPWSQTDLLYNHAEAEAALLGWLWGVPCPVIDRWPAWLW